MDVNALMKQAKELQDKVAAAQDELAAMSLKGIAGNGLAIVELDGKYNLQKLTLSPDLMKEAADDAAAVITAAFMDAKAKVDATVDKVMGEATSGMRLPTEA
ncbi:MAG: YbaB/EbfC family nucleoid-associated protein [Rickettsiales bacterium]|jgi:DNA-binding YbaB/EbfC family protein|nr:YbaB/EbfC family nucleoid-associated protein [Rickettsiales bacterium]